MCHLWSRPAILLARKINSTHTVVTAPEDTEVRVQCPESPKLVRVIRGQWWLAMSAGCKASTTSCEIVARDKAAVKEEIVVVSVHTNVTAWTGEAFNFTVDTPAPLQCHKRHLASAEGVGVEAASDNAGGHWSGGNSSSRRHFFSYINLC
jgi:hypothetical protein